MDTEAHMASLHSYAPRQGHGLAHDPLNAIVAPRPIGWISTLGADGVRNLAPHSFFNAFNYTPPILGFASIGRKDTLANVEATREFVWNLATEPLAEAMNQTSAPVAPAVDEFALAGLTPLASLQVAPPRVQESPVTMECRCTQILRLQDAGGGALDSWLVLGEVVMVHIDTALLDGGVFQTARARPLLRAGGGGDYFTLDPARLMTMRRPR